MIHFPARAAKSKLQSTSGETISEVLVGVLIVGLATVLFATMVGVAVNISLTSTDRTTKTYEQLSQVDSSSNATSGSGTVTLSGDINTSFSVNTSTSDSNSNSDDPSYDFTRYWLKPSSGA